MKTTTNKMTFLEKILKLLESMKKVTAQKKDNNLFLYKNEVKFGIIEKKNVLLLNQDGKFSALNQDLLDRITQIKPFDCDTDLFLFKATQAYWLANQQNVLTANKKHDILKKSWIMNN